MENNPMTYIGLNHTADGKVYKNIASSCNKFLNYQDVVCVEYSENDIRYITTGNILEAYKMLRDEVNAKAPRSPADYIKCIGPVIGHYFGEVSFPRKQKEYYFNDKKFKSSEKKIEVSDLYHKYAATSVERAMLTQNLLTECGIETIFKVSGAIIDGKNTIHAYNIITINEKHYIFDTTMPTLKENSVCPIVCEIPEEIYQIIINPNYDIGYSIPVKYYNPLISKNVEVTYDAGRDLVYEKAKTYTKKV